jgi:hypothetical protein
MLAKINELYEESINEGKKVSEILMSYIAYDHLKSELNNYKSQPQWLEKVKVKAGVSGVKLIKEYENS